MHITFSTKTVCHTKIHTSKPAAAWGQGCSPMCLHDPYYRPFVCKNEKILPKVKVRKEKKRRDEEE